MNPLDQEIQGMRRELRELKAGALITPTITAYTKYFRIGAGSYPNGHGRVTYEPERGDIITDITSDLSYSLMTPNYGANTQDFYLISNTGSAFQNAPVIIQSTRPIAKVEMLD